MTDLRMIVTGGSGDLRLKSGDLELDQGLTSAVLVSLFSDGLAAADQELPDGGSDRRGWWAGSLLLSEAADSFGSLLWLLERAKLDNSALQRAREVVQDSLAWLLEDGIAETVEVTATRVDLEEILVQATISRGEATEFSEVWDGVRDEELETGAGRFKLLFR